MKKAALIVDNIFKAEIIMGIIVLGIITLISCKMPELVKQSDNIGKSQDETTPHFAGTVIVDPGHGGFDPGKIGIHGEKEKDINLAIALKLKAILESQGFKVIMTRQTDEDLCQGETHHRKRQDMINRCQLINDTYNNDSSTINISIHQNSYTSESVNGPQIFYFGKSDDSRELAKIMQKQMNDDLNIARPREAKENTSYYMLAKTNCPSVIVECGFLSNNVEATKLSDENYQVKVAESIVKGLICFRK